MLSPQQTSPAAESIYLDKAAKRDRIIRFRGYEMEIHDRKNSAFFLTSLALDGSVIFFSGCRYNNGGSAYPQLETLPMASTLEEAKGRVYADFHRVKYLGNDNVKGSFEGDVMLSFVFGRGRMVVEYVDQNSASKDKVTMEIEGHIPNLWTFSLTRNLDSKNLNHDGEEAPA